MKVGDQVKQRVSDRRGVVVKIWMDCGDRLLRVRWDADPKYPKGTFGGDAVYTSVQTEQSVQKVGR